MKDIECPYCSKELNINHDDGQGYAEDEVHQQQCGSCEKYFTFTTSIIYHYRPHKADCLNDGKHDYRRTKTYPPEYAKLRCSICDDEKPLLNYKYE